MDGKTCRILSAAQSNQFRNLFQAQKRRKAVCIFSPVVQIIETSDTSIQSGGFIKKNGTNFGLYLIYIVQNLAQTDVNLSLFRWILRNVLIEEDYKSVDFWGRNVLHYCVITNKLYFFRKLICKCPINVVIARDKFGLNPLHYSILLNDFETFETMSILLKENAISLDDECVCLIGRITPLMLVSNQNVNNCLLRMRQLLVRLGCSENLRDSWKQLNCEEWQGVGNKGVFLCSVLLRPQSNRADSLMYLTGKLRRDSRSEVGYDPLLINLFEKSKRHHFDRLFERQLKRLNAAIKADKQPETYHEIISALRNKSIHELQLSAVDEDTDRSHNRVVQSARSETLPPIGLQRSHTIQDLLQVYTEQRTDAFRKQARPLTPPKTPPPDCNAVLGNRSGRRKITTITTMGKFSAIASNKQGNRKKLSGSKRSNEEQKSPKPGVRPGNSLNSMFRDIMSLQPGDDYAIDGLISGQNSLNSSFSTNFTLYK